MRIIRTLTTMASDLRPVVLVTGASGYIATHVVKLLLQDGYRVRGTVRSLENEQKVKPLRELCPDAKHTLELVEADLTREDSWLEAVRGCKYVLHTASPLMIGNSSDPSVFIKPAVEGTLAVLKACREVKGVSRVVLTSSVAAIISGRDLKTEVFTEEHWTSLDKSKSDYSKSKTLAEQAAWKFVEELPVDEKFELSVINPCVVLGPVLCGGQAASLEMVLQLFKGSVPAIPYVNFRIVDVRDVAKAHVVAMTLPEAAGKRHITAPGGMWMKEIVEVYREEFGPLGYKFARFQAPYPLVWLASFIDKRVSMLLPTWGVETKYKSDRMTKVLGIEPRPVRDTLIEMAHSMIQKGFVNKTPQYEAKYPSKD